MSAPRFSVDDALTIGTQLHLDWSDTPFDQFRLGLEAELEHGRRFPATDITHDDPIMTAKIALAHLRSIPDYYTRLSRMEAEAAGIHRGVTSHRLTGDPD